jgi:hypothetical protein
MRQTDGFVRKIKTSDRKYSKHAVLFKRQDLSWAGIAQSLQRLATNWTVKDQIPVEASFSACVRTGAGAHPASYTFVTGLLSASTPLGSGVEHPPPSKAEVKERIVIYLYSPLCVFVACSMANLLSSAKNFWYRIQRVGVSV